MRKLLLLLVMAPLLGWAQPVDISSTTIDYGSITTGIVDSSLVTLTNTSGYDINVTGMTFLDYYGISPFYAKDTNFLITAGGSEDVYIYVNAEQNMRHDLHMVLHTDFRGDYLIRLEAEARFSNTYYSSTYNKSEEDLKAALKSVLGQGYVSLGYNTARDNMYGSIDNVNGDVECVYTGRIATFNNRPGANANNFNCEHTFPQGFFNSNEPMKSDIHHLFPTDVTANSQRGNLPFGVVSGTPSWSVGGSKKNSATFEPRDVHKGDVARALFYFVLRYQDYSSHVSGQEGILRVWHENDAVSAKEMTRNEDIYSLQKNRSPFVDYPQLIKRINRIAGNSVAPSNAQLYVSRDTVDMRFKTDSMVYTVSVVNSGNEVITLSNFTIDDSVAFVFANAQSDRIMFPGEGFELKVVAVAQSNAQITDFIRFETDVPAMPNVDIALLGEWGAVGVHEMEVSTPLTVSPNPTQDNLQLQWEGHTHFDVRVVDLSGKTVLNQDSFTGGTLQLGTLPAGLYFVKATDKNTTATQRVVVQ